MIRPRESLTAQILVLACASGLAQVLYAVLLVLAASRAGPAETGAAVAAIAVGGFLGGCLDFGFTAYSVRELAAGRMTPAAYWSRFRGLLVLLLAVAAGTVVGGIAVGHPALGNFAALALVTRGLAMGFTAPYRADRRVFRVAAVALTERLTALFTFLLLTRGGQDDPLRALWWSLLAGAVSMTLVGLGNSGHRRALLRRVDITRPWAEGSGYGYFSLAVGTVSLDVLVLAAAGGSLQAGLYGVVSRWTQPIQLLAQTFSAAAGPVVARAASTRSAVTAIARSFWLLSLGLLISAAVAAAALAGVVPALVGEDYRESGRVLAVLAVGAAVVLFNQPFAAFLQARGHERFVGWATVGTVLFHLIAVWPAGRLAGAVGAAVSYGMAQVLLTLALVAGAWSIARRAGGRGGTGASPPVDRTVRPDAVVAGSGPR